MSAVIEAAFDAMFFTLLALGAFAALLFVGFVGSVVWALVPGLLGQLAGVLAMMFTILFLCCYVDEVA